MHHLVVKRFVILLTLLLIAAVATFAFIVA